MTDSFDVKQTAARFEAHIDGHTAYIDYHIQDGVMVYTHTEVPPALEGQGVGSRLAKIALDSAQAQHLKVQPVCPFVAAYIKRHPEYAPLVVV